ncbi:MAG: hypothetical protein ACOCG6_07755 [Candidatus Cloacimonadaceae bacterium]|jgi:uncharacterized protein YoxC
MVNKYISLTVSAILLLVLLFGVVSCKYNLLDNVHETDSLANYQYMHKKSADLPSWVLVLMIAIIALLVIALGMLGLLIYATFFMKENKNIVKRFAKDDKPKKAQNKNIKPWSWED